MAVTLRFPGDRLAQFTVSYVGNSVDAYTVVGSEGSVEVEPAFMFGMSLKYKLKVGTKETTESFKSTDHFGGELRYFSDCVLNDRAPEPDGQEGLLDVRVVEAILESARTARPVALAPADRPRRIDVGQVQKLSAVSPPTADRRQAAVEVTPLCARYGLATGRPNGYLSPVRDACRPRLEKYARRASWRPCWTSFPRPVGGPRRPRPAAARPASHRCRRGRRRPRR